MRRAELRFLSMREYAARLAERGRVAGWRCSPYQHPRYLRGRALSGSSLLLAELAWAGRRTLAGFVWEQERWVAHEGPAVGGARGAEALVDALASARVGALRMTTQCADSGEIRVDTAYATRVVALGGGVEGPYTTFAPACRRAVRRAGSSPLVCDTAEGHRALEWSEDVAGAFRDAPHRDLLPAPVFLGRYDALCRTGSAAVLRVRLDGAVAAMGILLRGAGIANLRYSVVRREGGAAVLRTRPGNALVWAAMRHLASRGIAWLDLSGVTLGSLCGQPNGIDRFKAGFGGEVWRFAAIERP
jgi:hypothetical protein